MFGLVSYDDWLAGDIISEFFLVSINPSSFLMIHITSCEEEDLIKSSSHALEHLHKQKTQVIICALDIQCSYLAFMGNSQKRSREVLRRSMKPTAYSMSFHSTM